ncbi:MAG TPA: YXWGXW repeat-containing protein [Usitatibacter sp.]|nr:YXWGXW repeat-containing protein [Usitatibacter sp.]
MFKRKALLAALALSSIALVPVPASAEIGVYLDIAPPAPRHEVIPAHRPGYVWQPGYWDWRAGRHVWVRGHWVRERPGYFWHPSRWENRGGRWYFEQGRWDRQRYAMRDRDRDGIPNRFDRDKDNDGRPDHRDRDRDGDGVPNRFDDRPNNPYRR